MDMATATARDTEKRRNSGHGLTIAVDFDGTIVEHKYPKIGKELPFAFDTLKAIQREGFRLILWTSREGERLEEAIEYCRKNGLVFYSVNSIYPTGYMFKGKGDTPRKLIADIYIDDRNLGGLPDWGTIYRIITGLEIHRPRKRSWWQRLFRKKSR